MKMYARPFPAWLEVAAIALLLVSAMIEPRVTVVLAVMLIVIGLVAVASQRRDRTG